MMRHLNEKLENQQALLTEVLQLEEAIESLKQTLTILLRAGNAHATANNIENVMQ